ncbi:hypothetical protein [Pseudodesulfovibrio sp. zrk46]|uniref:hypothetical protein n=1 Tax=Pseudodesulfovibrio sp. zrk46 TaxID=2725288 RepID=UPI0014496181|nr:hypothetical protein [Pseudodesulfovibrio sp. zrk46]QJB55777.1 hypothetical protein HFN16_04880 [Pseudodesulfovibrio sp. zrk46]
MRVFRIFATLVSAIGLMLLVMVFVDWWTGYLAMKFFPEESHDAHHHLFGLMLALPVPLHVIFVGLIVQKKWLSPPMAKFAWVGIVSSGLWLGASLAIRML